MRPQRSIPEQDLKILEKQLKQAKTTREYKYAQVLYLRGRHQQTGEEIARATQYSMDNVNKILKGYFTKGLKLFKDMGKPTSRRRYNLTAKEEQIFIEQYLQEAKAGRLIEVSRIKKAYEQRIGRKTSKSVVYSILHRHNWRKIVPRPRHPKHNVEKAAAFKKTLPH
jgi:transposase